MWETKVSLLSNFEIGNTIKNDIDYISRGAGFNQKDKKPVKKG